MKARPQEDMSPRSRRCPHCGAVTVNIWLPGRGTTCIRCPVCGCRWRPDGKHVVTGRGCALQKRVPLST